MLRTHDVRLIQTFAGAHYMNFSEVLISPLQIYINYVRFIQYTTTTTNNNIFCRSERQYYSTKQKAYVKTNM